MTIWLNVSTSVAWRRPPLGIVRVERRLAGELARALGPRGLRYCVWDRDHAAFFPWEGRDPAAPPDPELDDTTLLGEAPARGRLDRLRSIGGEIALIAPNWLRPVLAHLGRALETMAVAVRDRLRRAQRSRGSIGLRGRTQTGGADGCFDRGDILITLGLDWETGFAPVLAALKGRLGLGVVGCCYDTVPVRYPHYTTSSAARLYADYLGRMARYCDAIACISACTETDLRKVLPELGVPTPRLFRIRLGTDLPEGSQPPSEAVAVVAARPFILYVSTIERRKNHEVLYRAFHRLAQRYDRERLPRLVFVGSPGWGVTDTLSDISADPSTQGLITLLHRVSDSDLRLLYQSALFCVFPSLYEGWGMPVAEALSFGKPVICSDRGALPEVGGDLVDYLDPWDLPGWVRALEQLWLDARLRAQKSERIRERFSPGSWTDTARPIAAVALELDSRTLAHRIPDDPS